MQRVHLARREAIGASWVRSIDYSALLSDTMHARFFWVTSCEWEHDVVIGSGEAEGQRLVWKIGRHVGHLLVRMDVVRLLFVSGCVGSIP